MSNWNGSHGKGAMKARRAEKKAEAESRREQFEADIERVMREQNVIRAQAHYVVETCRKNKKLRIEHKASALATPVTPEESLLHNIFGDTHEQ